MRFTQNMYILVYVLCELYLLCLSELHIRFVTVNCNLPGRYRMNGPSYCLCMYHRTHKQTGELRNEFISGVEDFDKFARS